MEWSESTFQMQPVLFLLGSWPLWLRPPSQGKRRGLVADPSVETDCAISRLPKKPSGRCWNRDVTLNRNGDKRNLWVDMQPRDVSHCLSSMTREFCFSHVTSERQKAAENEQEAGICTSKDMSGNADSTDAQQRSKIASDGYAVEEAKREAAGLLPPNITKPRLPHEPRHEAATDEQVYDRFKKR